ncbi:class I SAM-dependent methyltransferase [Labrys wisconsinensis]|uniref:Methyltransferase n=1 Tax=Labrys wisconsinensis TaxID=425677 RepID=A0ABU0J5Q9_9HYPH|nr:methyltransferase [Labrys wisconsinensis]MDQ0468808.1 putative methyltransferase [Labrys wisconsinensis]
MIIAVPMRRSRLSPPLRILALLVAVAAALPATAQEPADQLQRLVAGPQRSEKNRVRDPYRHPLEVLTFFGVRPDSDVVEILPGAGGYWTEILAPYLREHGRYTAANGEAASPSAEVQKDNAGFKAKIAADPADYGKVAVSEFAADRHDIAPPGSADFVLTFRNIHNWMAAGETQGAFGAFYKALKPGGILGVEEHRGKPGEPQDPLAKSGYVRQDVAIGFAEAAGFRFVGSSEVNANPKDTKDYPAGVWALPPTFRLGDQDRAKYAAIGESDRFILKFVKPAP